MSHWTVRGVKQAGARAITPLTLFDRRDGLLTVDEVVGHDGSARRLGELGLCEGRSISVVRGGDPAIVEVDGSRLALSRDLQNRIFVRPGHEAVQRDAG